MSLYLPNGYIENNCCVWGDLSKKSVVTHGYKFVVPDLMSMSDSTLERWEEDLRVILASIQREERLQVHYYTGSDFETALSRYDEDTERYTAMPKIRAMREQLTAHYRSRANEAALMRAEARIFVSFELGGFGKGKTQVKGVDKFLAIAQQSASQRELIFNGLLAVNGGECKALDSYGLYTELHRYLCPGKPILTPEEIDYELPVQQLAAWSGFAPREQSPKEQFGVGFYHDYKYYGVIAMNEQPRQTSVQSLFPLFKLMIPDMRIVLNCRPLKIEDEIEYEQKRFDSLASNVDGKQVQLEALAGLPMHRERVAALLSGKTIPYEMQLIVIVNGDTPLELSQRLRDVHTMLYQCSTKGLCVSLPEYAVDLWISGTPGVGCWIKSTNAFRHRMDDLHVSNMMPFFATPEADLKDADWIAEGAVNNLVGGKFWRGNQPVHMLVMGMTRSGKSSTLQALYLQNAGKVKVEIIVDNALSYIDTIETLDPECRPLIIKSGCGYTFNPFDTRGVPLHPSHVSSVAGIVNTMIGVSSDEQHNRLTQSILTDAIQSIYREYVHRWEQEYPSLWTDAVRLAMVVEETYQALEKGETRLDAWRTVLSVEPSERQAALDAIPSAAIQKFYYRHKELVGNMIVSFWTPDQFPRLFDLHDELVSMSYRSGDNSSQESHDNMRLMAKALQSWLHEGTYGALFDGVGNVSLGGEPPKNGTKVLYFDLGDITDSQADLRAVVGFLLTNEVQNYVTSLPRDIKKRVTFEELGGMLKIPNIERVISDFSERMSKYNCQFVTVFQNIDSIEAKSKAAVKAITGNVLAMAIFRAQNRKNLERLNEYIKLPESINDCVLKFPMPEDLKAKNPDKAYSGFVWVQLEEETPKCTVVHYYMPANVARMVSSSGVDFEAKRQERNRRKVEYAGAAQQD
jgi:hypothetical protein